MQVQKDQRHQDGSGARSDQGEDFAGAGDVDHVGYVSPDVEPEHDRQKRVEPLLVDQASDQLRYHPPFSERGSWCSTLSSVIGKSRTRTPVALYTAFATAAAAPQIPSSPMPLAPRTLALSSNPSSS